ncbi:MAG: hypothetical protein AAF563_23840 [Pseudomonadota bacterium]
MIRTIALVVFAISILAASTTRAQNVYSWICNIEGAPAELTAQVEAVNSAGVYMDPNGLFAGSVSLDQVIYYYQGSLVSQTGQYSFVGENEYADFTDLYTNQRFRVRMIVQGRELLMVVNPFGPQPAQYLCQMR